jgi:mannosyltransferase OCH1-like enzyme
MTFEEAIRKSIAKYFKGHSFDALQEATGKEMKYTLEYFDQLEKDMLEGTDVEPEEMAVEEDDTNVPA